MRKLHKQTGFTLAELLIVVAIIAILVAIGIPAFSTAMERSRETVDLSNIRGAYAEFMAGTLGGTANTGYYKVTIKQRDCSKWIIDTNGFLANIVEYTEVGDDKKVKYVTPTQMPNSDDGLKTGEMWIKFSTVEGKIVTGEGDSETTTYDPAMEKPILTFVASDTNGYPDKMPQKIYGTSGEGTSKTDYVVMPLNEGDTAPLSPTETDWYLTVEAPKTKTTP